MMNQLKTLRKNKRLTQQELADHIGVTQRTIIAWEKGERDIKSDKAQKLADFFGVSLGFLLGFATAKEEPERPNRGDLGHFQNENDAILSLGYVLSDRELQTILHLIHTFSQSNNAYFWKLIEHKDHFIENILESEYLSFYEQNPDFLDSLKKDYKDYQETVNASSELTINHRERADL